MILFIIEIVLYLLALLFGAAFGTVGLEPESAERNSRLVGTFVLAVLFFILASVLNCLLVFGLPA